MEVVRTIRPGDKGSHHFVKIYGERLVAVRYRKSASHRFTTVELIVERRVAKKTYDEINAIETRKRVPLRIGYAERELHIKIKEAGGSWNPKNKVWELSYQNAVALGLKDRIISLPDNR
jgi:hypothetical protein